MTISKFLLIALLATNHSFAQSPVFDSAPIQSNTGTGTNLERPVDTNEKWNYFLRTSGTAHPFDYYLQAVDKDMKNVTTYQLLYEKSNSLIRRETDRIFVEDGKAMLTSQIRINKEDKSYYALHYFDNTGTKISEKTLLSMPIDGLMNSGDYFSALSKDRSKFVVIGIYPEVKGQTFQHVAMVCYNFPDMTVTWSKEFDLEIPSHDYPRFITSVDNTGNLAFYTSYKSKIAKGCKFFTYKWREDKLTNIDLKLTEEMSLHDEQLTQLDSGVFLFSGFFVDNTLLKSKALQGKMSHGHFIIRTSNTDQVELNQRELFDSNFYKTIYENEKLDEHTPYITNYKVRGVLQRSDSKFVWVLEFNTMKSKTEGTGSVTYTTYTHAAHALLVMCFNPQTGKIDWMNRINKSQEEVSRQKETQYIYTIPYLHNDSLFLIYNNTELNTNGSGGKWVEADGKEYTKGALFGSNVMYAPFLRVIDKEGNEVYKHLKYGLPMDNFNTNETPSGWYISPVNYINNSKAGLFVVAQNYNGSSYQLVKVKF